MVGESVRGRFRHVPAARGRVGGRNRRNGGRDRWNADRFRRGSYPPNDTQLRAAVPDCRVGVSSGAAAHSAAGPQDGASEALAHYQALTSVLDAILVRDMASNVLRIAKPQ